MTCRARLGRVYALTSDGHEQLKLENARNMWGLGGFFRGMHGDIGPGRRVHGFLIGYEGRIVGATAYRHFEAASSGDAAVIRSEREYAET